MVIINLGAIICAIFAVILWFIFKGFVPPPFSDPSNDLTIFVLVTISGTIGELIGLKPRISYVPMALAGLIGAAYFGLSYWKWYYVIPAFSLSVGLFYVVKVRLPVKFKILSKYSSFNFQRELAKNKRVFK